MHSTRFVQLLNDSNLVAYDEQEQRGVAFADQLSLEGAALNGDPLFDRSGHLTGRHMK